MHRKWWENRRLFLLSLLILLVGMLTISINEVTQNQHLKQMSEFQLYTNLYEDAQSVELNLDNILVFKLVQPFAHNAQSKLMDLIENGNSANFTSLAQEANVDIVRHDWKKAIQQIVHYKSAVHNQLVQTMDTMMRDIRFEKATTIYSLGFDILLTLLLVFLMVRDERWKLRETKRALSESESRLSAAMMNLPVILFTLDATGTFIAAMGKRLKEIQVHGESLIGENVFEIYKEYPEILSHIRHAMQCATSDEVFTDQLTFNQRIFEISYVALDENENQHKTITGIALDITEHKAMEEILRLADMAFETADAMTITDKNAMILRVNQSFTKVTGYEQHEALGKNPRILQSGLHDKIFYEHFWDSLLKNDVWEGEIWNKRKNGEIYPEWIKIRAVKDENHTIVNYVATFYDLTEKKVLEANIERLAHYDSLTGLANRRMLMEQLKLALKNASQRQTIGGLILIDLDRFKYLNDARGHEKGDLLLNQVARKLEGMLPPGALVSRFGGDEFIVLINDIALDKRLAWEELLRESAKIHQGLIGNYPIGDSMHALTVSIGATIFSDYKQTYEDIIKEADMAMHVAKERGRNTVVLFEDEMMTATENRFSLEEDLYYALDHHELELVYQPQTDHEGNLCGVEALLRWNHQKRGIISPVRFIPIAEDSGLIVPIGEWVLRQSCILLRKMMDSGQHVFVSVNVSPRQFHEANFVEVVMDIIEETRIDPHYLTIEVTESVLIDYAENTIEKMQCLSQVGVRFSIDDFGTGYSSLAYLKSLPLNELKIDRSFIVDMMTIPSAKMIVETIIAMASHLGLSVIAEGVETKDQVQFLAERGCDNFQGYYFSHPLPYEKFTTYAAQAH